MKNKPKHIGYQTAIEFSCDNCGVSSWSKKSHFKRKKRHFCSMACYSKFRSDKMNFTEQNSYKGVRQEGESKQVYHINYCKTNRSKINHLKSVRYARQKGSEGSHTLSEWEDLKAKNNFICVKCSQKKKLTKDHIIPISKGGSNFIKNIQPLCRNCNSKKHNKIENAELLNG